MKLQLQQICFYGLSALLIQISSVLSQRAAKYESRLENLDKIPTTPRIVFSSKYISPKDALKSTRSRRKAQQKSTHDPDTFSYIDNYHAFLDQNFNDRLTKLENQKQRPADAEHFEGGGGGSGGDDSGYNYNNDYHPSKEYEQIKAESDAQAAEIKKDPKQCKQVKKGEMTCFTCKDPKNGAQSQSCSYSSEPVSKKYAYQKEKNYDSKNEEPSEDEEESDGKELAEGSSEIQKTGKSANLKVAPKKSQKKVYKSVNSKPIRSMKKRYQTSETRPQRDIVGLDPFLFGTYESDETDTSPEKSGQLRSYDDYYSHVFPAKTKENLQKSSDADTDFEYVSDDVEAKKDVDRALAEFKTKDWSNCDQMEKGDLTCYYCKDKGGVKHEECMYVSESSPKSSYLAYSDNSSYHQPSTDGDELKLSASNQRLSRVSTPTPKTSSSTTTKSKPKKRPIKKATTNKKGAVPHKTATVVHKNEAANKKDFEPENKLNPINSQESGSQAKHTIKRKVTFKLNDELDPKKSRVMYYEHHVSHVE